MSDLHDLIARASVLAYQQGRKDERINILKLADEAAVRNDNGDYVYISDLSDYINNDEEKRNEKRNSQKD